MLQPGDRIGRYEIQRRLGRGGMGTVYVAHDPNLGRLVAVKVFAGDLDAAEAADKFNREARAAAALNHPHIVTIHDFGDFDSQPFIVMEYIQGDTLARLIRRKVELSLPERLRLIEELCAGVAYAHGFDVIHRDIKPANLMVDRSGRLKILDFGIARMLGSSLSKATALIGTPGYMAPEQIHGGAIDRRSDIFSVGVVTYELLSYAEAFPGDSVPAITHRILTEEPASLTKLVPAIPAELVAIVEKALKKDAAGRFADAGAFGAAIAQVQRSLSNDPRWEVSMPTLPGGARPAHLGSGPGSDAGKTPSHGSNPPATTPAPRVGREDIVRRRTAQIEAALSRARTLLQADQLDDALEACVQALTLDDLHAEAIQVEHDIRTAMARHQAAALVAEGREGLGRGALTAVQQILRQARELDPESVGVRQLDRDLRLARVEQEDARQRAESVQRALDGAASALERGDHEAALTAARQALRLDPQSDGARQVEAEARRRLDAELGVEIVHTARVPAIDASDAPVAAVAVSPLPVVTTTPAPAPPVVMPLPHAAGGVVPSVSADPSGEVPAPTILAPGNRPAADVSKAAKPAAPLPLRPPSVPTPSLAASASAATVLSRITTKAGGTMSRGAEAARRLATVTVPRHVDRTRVLAAAWGGRAVEAMRAAARAVQNQGRLTPHAANSARVWWMAAGLLVAGVAVAIAVSAWPTPPAVAPVALGTLTVDAVPWATVTAIVGSDGAARELPPSASTPMSLQLPPGTYRITLTGPATAASQEVTVRVTEGQSVTAPEVRFPGMTVEAYFEPYLAARPESVTAEAPLEAVASPASSGGDTR